MDWFRARKTREKSVDSEGKKLRQLAYSMLVDLPYTHWKLADSISSTRVTAFERSAIQTVLESGKHVKIVRRVCRPQLGAPSGLNAEPEYSRRYEFFIDRILMGHEEYFDAQDPLDHLAKLFEDIYPKLTTHG